MALLNIDEDGRTLAALAGISQTGNGEIFLEHLRGSLLATAMEDARVMDVYETYVIKGYMRCLNDLISRMAGAVSGLDRFQARADARVDALLHEHGGGTAGPRLGEDLSE